MRSFFALIGAALLAAAFSGGATLWDGSQYLFQILDAGTPFVPHQRLIVVPLHAPVLLARALTGDPAILAVILGLTYAAVPVGALALSWWIVRDRAPALFVWAAFGIGLGTLPLQLHLVSEAVIAIQLFWPLQLAILTGARRRHLPVVACLATAIFLAHPFAIPLFVVAAATAGLAGLRDRRAATRRAWAWGAAAAALAAAAAWRLLTGSSSYDTGQLTPAVVRAAIGDALAGPAGIALVCAWLAAVLTCAGPYVGRLRSPRPLLALYAAELGTLAVAGCVLFAWAREPRLWAGAIGFRTVAFFASLPFIGLATLDGLGRGGAGCEGEGATGGSPVGQRSAREWGHRIHTSQVIATVALIVLVAQGTAWAGLSQQLVEAMREIPYTCVSRGSLGWIAGTALDAWSLPAHSLLLQGRDPQHVVLEADQCASGKLAEGLPLTPWQRRPWQDGHLALAPLGTRLVAEEQHPRGCRALLSSQWYPREQSGGEWWAWDNGQGSVFVAVERDVAMQLQGQLESPRRPNAVTVLLNGTAVSTVRVTWSGLRPIAPIVLPLKAGPNVIRFVGDQATVRVPPDERPLGVAVANLTLVADGGSLACEPED